MKQKWLSVGLLALVLLLAFGSIAQAQDKTLYWQRYDVDITVQKSGDLRVVETQELVFTSGTFRYGQREVLQNRFSGLSDITVSELDGPSTNNPIPMRRTPIVSSRRAATPRSATTSRPAPTPAARSSSATRSRARCAITPTTAWISSTGRSCPPAIRSRRNLDDHPARAGAGDLHQLWPLWRQGERLSRPASAMRRSRSRDRSTPARRWRWWPNGSTASWRAQPQPWQQSLDAEAGPEGATAGSSSSNGARCLTWASWRWPACC